MQPKPAHLGPAYGAQFGDASVVDAYHHRPPYADESFAILRGLIDRESPSILDLGCGTGEIARRLAPYVATVDAIDPAERMLARARMLPGGDASNIRWIPAPAETAPFAGEYDMVIAGASLHWMAWEVVFPRLAASLVPNGFLVILEQEAMPAPWDAKVSEICGVHSTNREYRSYDVVEELTSRGLLDIAGSKRTPVRSFAQPVPAYVESFHARNGFSRDRMTAQAADGFDRLLNEAVHPYAPEGDVQLELRDVLTWGVPSSGVTRPVSI